jgi:hypothetical protein
MQEHLTSPPVASIYSSLRSSTNLSPLDKATRILAKFKKDAIHISKDVLGTARTPARFTQYLPMDSYTQRFNALQHIISPALRITLNPRSLSLDGNELALERAWWPHHNIDLPHNRMEWLTWWQSRHAFLSRLISDSQTEKHLLTDASARTDPKGFYNQLTKPFIFTHISSIRHNNRLHTTDTSIETALSDFLKGIGTKSNEPYPQPPPNYSPIPKLS